MLPRRGVTNKELSQRDLQRLLGAVMAEQRKALADHDKEARNAMAVAMTYLKMYWSASSDTLLNDMVERDMRHFVRFT